VSRAAPVRGRTVVMLGLAFFIGGTSRAFAQAANWTGGYVGAQLGLGNGSVDTGFAPVAPDPAHPFKALKPVTLTADTQGLLVGGQGGFNFQAGRLVVGGQADFARSTIDGSTSVTPIVREDGSTQPGSLTAAQSTRWLLNVGPRFGVQSGQALIFGTVGISLAQVKDTALTDYRPNATNHYPGALDATKHGWHWGAGAEIAASKKLSVFGELLSYRFTVANEAEARTFDADPPDEEGFQVAYTWIAKPTLVFRGGINIRF